MISVHLPPDCLSQPEKPLIRESKGEYFAYFKHSGVKTEWASDLIADMLPNLVKILV